MNDKDIVIEKIEEIFIDSDLSMYEAIGVLEIVKQLLFKAVELKAREHLDEEETLEMQKDVASEFAPEAI